MPRLCMFYISRSILTKLKDLIATLPSPSSFTVPPRSYLCRPSRSRMASSLAEQRQLSIPQHSIPAFRVQYYLPESILMPNSTTVVGLRPQVLPWLRKSVFQLRLSYHWGRSLPPIPLLHYLPLQFRILSIPSGRWLAR